MLVTLVIHCNSDLIKYEARHPTTGQKSPECQAMNQKQLILTNFQFHITWLHLQKESPISPAWGACLFCGLPRQRSEMSSGKEPPGTLLCFCRTVLWSVPLRLQENQSNIRKAKCCWVLRKGKMPKHTQRGLVSFQVHITTNVCLWARQSTSDMVSHSTSL